MRWWRLGSILVLLLAAACASPGRPPPPGFAIRCPPADTEQRFWSGSLRAGGAEADLCLRREADGVKAYLAGIYRHDPGVESEANRELRFAIIRDGIRQSLLSGHGSFTFAERSAVSGEASLYRESWTWLGERRLEVAAADCKALALPVGDDHRCRPGVLVVERRRTRLFDPNSELVWTYWFSAMDGILVREKQAAVRGVVAPPPANDGLVQALWIQPGRYED
jgi:hypothetical protein